MEKALHKSHTGRSGVHSGVKAAFDWRRRISDHIAYGLLAYTGLQIFVTMSALKSTSGSILPYFLLVLLVAGIIPACRMMERRWEGLAAGRVDDPQLAPLFRRDRVLIWAAAIGLPFFITGVLKALAFIV